MRRPGPALLVLLLLAVGLASTAEAARRRARASVAETVRSKTCDRTCLNAFLDRYVEALLAHDPGRAELAADLRSTENGVAVPPGAGVWRTISEVGDYRIRAIDPMTGGAVLLGVLYEDARPTMFALRLKVQARHVSESELLLARDVPPAFAAAVPRLRIARRAFGDRVEPPARLPRARLIEVVNAYYDGIGQERGGTVPFADDCHRVENGVAVVNNPGFPYPPVSSAGATLPDFAALDCRTQFDSGIWSAATLAQRRFPLVDEERGLVVAFTQYDAYARAPCAAVAAVATVGTVGPVCPEGATPPASRYRMEILRVGDGRIHEAEAVWTLLPPGRSSGW